MGFFRRGVHLYLCTWYLILFFFTTNDWIYVQNLRNRRLLATWLPSSICKRNSVSWYLPTLGLGNIDCGSSRAYQYQTSKRWSQEAANNKVHSSFSVLYLSIYTDDKAGTSSKSNSQYLGNKEKTSNFSSYERVMEVNLFHVPLLFIRLVICTLVPPYIHHLDRTNKDSFHWFEKYF